MPPVQDANVTNKPPIWKTILNVIYSVLGALKAAGKFSKKDGPQS